jgi:uncharacterized protein YjhX (UPF0386 family)
VRIYYKAKRNIRRLLNHLVFRAAGLDYSQCTLMNIRKLKRKTKCLAKHGGRMHVSERGGLSHRFKTKSGEMSYNKEIRKIAGKNIAI